MWLALLHSFLLATAAPSDPTSGDPSAPEGTAGAGLPDAAPRSSAVAGAFFAMATEIVLPGRRDDEAAVAAVIDGERWLVLEQAASGWRLREGPIHLTRTVPTSPFDATAAYYEARVDPADGATQLLFVRGGGLREGPVVASSEPPPTVGQPTVYAAPDGTPVTVGIFGRIDPHPSGYAAGLFRDMTVQISAGHGEPWQAFLGPVSHNESPPAVLWAGDLDRDGALDLLTVTPLGGGGSETSLWLSSAGGKGRAVGLAATFVNAGC